jgi:hypothetical protein
MPKTQLPKSKKRVELDPRDIVLQLFKRYEAQINENLWPWEIKRWYELVFCILTTIGEPEVLASTIRLLTDTLSELGMLDLHTLANLKLSGNAKKISNPFVVTIRTLLHLAGFTSEKSRIALKAISEAASSLEKKYNGKVQNYFRKYGVQILDNINEDFRFSEFDNSYKAISIWLQNTLNMPVPALDNLAKEACKSLGVTYEVLVEAANKQDINVALLDDVLRFYWESEMTQQVDDIPGLK